VLNAWGGPGHHPGWPPGGAIHTVVVDKEHNVWISAAGRGNGIQKFTRVFQRTATSVTFAVTSEGASWYTWNFILYVPRPCVTECSVVA